MRRRLQCFMASPTALSRPLPAATSHRPRQPGPGAGSRTTDHPPAAGDHGGDPHGPVAGGARLQRRRHGDADDHRPAGRPVRLLVGVHGLPARRHGHGSRVQQARRHVRPQADLPVRPDRLRRGVGHLRVRHVDDAARSSSARSRASAPARCSPSRSRSSATSTRRPSGPRSRACSRRSGAGRRSSGRRSAGSSRRRSAGRGSSGSTSRSGSSRRSCSCASSARSSSASRTGSTGWARSCSRAAWRCCCSRCPRAATSSATCRVGFVAMLVVSLLIIARFFVAERPRPSH